jgi:hypothetical protein
MKKVISILTFTLLTVCVTHAQDIIRSIKAVEWKKTLEKDVIYTIVPDGNTIIIKEGEINLHSLAMPNSLIFSSAIDSTTDEGVIVYGRKWATRNLAAHGKFVEKPEDPGALFQWGRIGDGHEQRTSLRYPTDDTSLEDGVVYDEQNFDEHGQVVNTHDAYGKFIKQGCLPFCHYDWREPQIDTLWNAGSEIVPVKTANDPCPDGWRMPTRTELAQLWNGVWTNTPAPGRLFGSGTDRLFLPATGCRNNYNGLVVGTGTFGYYWSSSNGGISVSNHPDCIYGPGNNSYFLYFFNTHTILEYSFFRAYGFAVRCVAEE